MSDLVEWLEQVEQRNPEPAEWAEIVRESISLAELSIPEWRAVLDRFWNSTSLAITEGILSFWLEQARQRSPNWFSVEALLRLETLDLERGNICPLAATALDHTIERLDDRGWDRESSSLEPFITRFLDEIVQRIDSDRRVFFERTATLALLERVVSSARGPRLLPKTLRYLAIDRLNMSKLTLPDIFAEQAERIIDRLREIAEVNHSP